MRFQWIRSKVLLSIACALLVAGIASGCSSKKKDPDSSSKDTTSVTTAVANGQGGSGEQTPDQGGGQAAPGSDGVDPNAPVSVQEGVVPADVDPSVPFEQKVWELDLIESNAVIDSVMPVLVQFEKDKVTGNGGCNSFSGSLSIDGSNIKIGEIATSGIPCGVAEDEAAEKEFFKQLRSATSIAIEPARVVLTISDGTLVFKLFHTGE